MTDDNDGDLDVYLLGHIFFRNGGKPEKPPTVLKDGTYQVLPNFSKYFQVNLNSTNGFKLDTAGARDYLMINDNGTFRDVTMEAGINSKPWQGNSVTWRDFNNDGHQDIYIANDFELNRFLTTSFFLFGSYYFLGERRWILMFLLSFPFVAAFMYLLHGVLEIYLRDPFLQLIGVMG